MDKINKNYQNFNRLSEIYFKIKIIENTNNDTKKENNDIENYLELLKKEDLTDFLISLGIFTQSYDINFLVNSNNEYFIKFEILTPSLNDLLNNKNHQCIFPDCYEIIINYRNNFCTEHLEHPNINNYEIMNQYFDIHSQELKKIFTDYKNQKNLSNFIKSNNNNIEPIIISYKSSLKDIIYNFELTTDINKLIEIQLTNEINELDCGIYNNFSNSESESDSELDFDFDLDDELSQNNNKTPTTPTTPISKSEYIHNDKDKDKDSDSDNENNNNDSDSDNYNNYIDDLSDCSNSDSDIELDQQDLNLLLNEFKKINHL
jgi:hypothetical protein